MVDNDDANGEDTSSPEEWPDDDYYLDPLLRSIVELVNQLHFEITITLNLGGMLVSGLLISVADYYLALGEAMRGVGGTVAESFQKSFTELGTLEGLETQLADAGAEMPPAAHIHLRRARFHDGAGVFGSADGVYWRGRLEEVKGWNLGEIRPLEGTD